MLRTVSESQERTRRIPAKALNFQNSCFLHLLRGSPRATSGKPGQRRERKCSPRCLGPRPLVSSNSTGKGSWVRIPPPASLPSYRKILARLTTTQLGGRYVLPETRKPRRQCIFRIPLP